MQKYFLEPGILRVFRFYLIFQFVLIVINVLAHTNRGLTERNAHAAVGFAVVGILFLLGYLSWPFLRKILGRSFFPIAIFLSTVFSLVQQNRFLQIHFSPGDISSQESAWQVFLFLFIPLILCAWQYNFKAVILYCLFTAFVDFQLIAHMNPDFSLTQETYRRLIFIRSFSFLITGYVIAYIMSRFRKQRASLEEANRGLTHYASTLEELTVSRERNRMARELHDTLAHTLSGIAVQLEAAHTVLPESPDEAQSLVARSLDMTRSGLTETRRSLKDLRATPLEDLGLDQALRALASESAERTGFELDYQGHGSMPNLPPDIEQGIYRVVQETFENISRHSDAHSVRLKWTAEPGLLSITISDDGRGFSSEQTGSNEHHFGLRGMRERADLIGADFEVTSLEGQGTIIELKVKV